MIWRVQEGLLAEVALPRSILAGYEQTPLQAHGSLVRTFNPISASSFTNLLPVTCAASWVVILAVDSRKLRLLILGRMLIVVEHLQHVRHCSRRFTIHSFSPQ